MEKLGGWSHARYMAESQAVDRLLEQGAFQAAEQKARVILQHCIMAGEDAYPVAAYDCALAHFRLGRTLSMMGRVEEAFEMIRQAQQRFQALAAEGVSEAEGMASACMTESADCLSTLGRLDEAADLYAESITLAEKSGDHRGAAVGKGQLATVRMYQRKYDDALQMHAEARDTFEQLGEPRTVATAWHQIGMVHEEARNHPEAEKAYRESLAIEVHEGDLFRQAGSLNQLGNLYAAMNRLEDSVIFLRQAADISARQEDLAAEGRSRHNLSLRLIELRRYDDARTELMRAIECIQSFGLAAQPWKTWAMLYELERIAGNTQATARARTKAVESYLAYRRQGGVGQGPAAQLMVRLEELLARNGHEEATRFIDGLPPEWHEQDWFGRLLPKLQAIIAGSRDPALADDPDLDYDEAVEMRLLLERLKG